MSRFEPRRYAALTAICVGLITVTAAVYLPVGDFGFVSYNDPEYVEKSPMVRHGLSVAGLRWALSGIHHGNWHPLTTLSYMVECEIFGVDAGAQHRVNLGLHILNTLMLFFLLFETTRARGRSAMVAALFALHPLSA